MAVYIIMLKDYEDEERVVYSYGPSEDVMGKIEYDKKNEVINQISPIVSENYADEFFFKRAGRRLARMIIKENGNFVEKTTIES
ncbi:hypothetical protein ACYCSE_21820 [Paenibacillus sp. SEL1]|uniref:Uncharacterized protein n=1 Tax=Paenibacillus polymyxa TaxID=1406 RepID=A0AAE9IG93_PAEPO|nr:MULTISPECIES: hypothetical protein [Paenibacillus]MCP3781102.1 hypothetical protein [Paenibacillus sp. MZ03-122A]MCP3797247.1 hypothetical protein [Paenibacillus sp. CH40]MDY7993426.1 hypothetical protein [Paenibacillus polymyxa]MDY8048546.1 hypothetical protein [Paenibacillus polymyxa]MDY8119973.1 hypothetical protein [Paenibacillus polymyxa]